jgi:hypothetical protein
MLTVPMDLAGTGLPQGHFAVGAAARKEGMPVEQGPALLLGSGCG